MNIFKIKSAIYLTVLVLLVSSCSILLKNKEKAKAKRPVIEITPGPTQLSMNFIDKTKDYGLENISGVRFYSVDLNNDFFSDLVVLPSYYSQPRFFYFDPKNKKFTEYNFDPFAKSVRASMLLFYDLDNDDILDLIVGVLNQKTELTKYSIRIFKGSIINNKIWFTELKDFIKSSPSPTASISVLDVDHDGLLDIFEANWYQYDNQNNPWPVPDRLYLRRGNKFEDYSQLLIDELTKNETNESYIKATPSFASSICDIDDNGFADILTASSNGYENKMWLNEYQLNQGKLKSNRYFKNYARVSEMAMDQEGFLVPRGGGNTFTATCADYNDDGLMDIYLGEMTHSYDGDSIDRSSVLTNISKKFPPKFIRTEYLGDSTNFNWSRADKRSNWIDLNMDGLLDILVDNSGFPPDSRLVYFQQTPDRDFYDTSNLNGINILNPEGTIITDINQDGRPDIITGQSNIRSSEIKQRIYLYENNIETQKKKLFRIYPRGVKANSSAIGAMVSINIKRDNKIKTFKKFVEYSQGAQPSQNEEGIYFTLLENDKLEKIDIRFPVFQNQTSKERSFLEKSFNLSNIKFNHNNQLTLCDDGKIYFKRRFCR